jgi:SWI/SNF related-matrix-associated actin-dependent regulator of chromatin subfamily C
MGEGGELGLDTTSSGGVYAPRGLARWAHPAFVDDVVGAVRAQLLHERRIVDHVTADALAAIARQMCALEATGADVASRVPPRVFASAAGLLTALRVYLEALADTGLELGVDLADARYAALADRLHANLGRALAAAGCWAPPRVAVRPAGAYGEHVAAAARRLGAVLTEVPSRAAGAGAGAVVVDSDADALHIARDASGTGAWPVFVLDERAGLVLVHPLYCSEAQDSWIAAANLVRGGDDAECVAVPLAAPDGESRVVTSRWVIESQSAGHWLDPADFDVRLIGGVGALPAVRAAGRAMDTALVADFARVRGGRDHTFVPPPELETAVAAARSRKAVPREEPVDVPRLAATDFANLGAAEVGKLLAPHPAAHWFCADDVHTIERDALPDFFDGSSAYRTPAVYKDYRLFMMAAYAANPSQYLTVTACRRSLAGDANAVMRVHAFLSRWRLINAHVPTASRPKYAFGFPALPEDVAEAAPGAKRVALAAADADSDGGGMALEPADGGGGARATAPAPIATSVLPDVMRTLEIQNSAPRVLSAKSISPFALPAARDREELCGVCGSDATQIYYCSSEHPDFVVCTKCIANLPEGMNSRTFEKRVAIGSAVSTSVWREEETVRLLEALHRYGDSWERVAEHVGTRSMLECVMHFVQLPIEEPFLHSHSLPAKRVRSADAGRAVPYTPSSNPVSSLIDFLSSSVDPAVAAAAGRAVREALPAPAPSATTAKAAAAEHAAAGGDAAAGADIGAEPVLAAAAAAVGVAAVRAQVVATGLEREILRCTLEAVDLTVARLEAKLENLQQLEDALVRERERLDCKQ